MIRELNKQTTIVEESGKPSVAFQQLYNELVRKLREVEERLAVLEP